MDPAADEAAGIDEEAAAKTLEAATRFIDRIRCCLELAAALLRLEHGNCCIELVKEVEQEAGPPRAKRPGVDIEGGEKLEERETNLNKRERKRSVSLSVVVCGSRVFQPLFLLLSREDFRFSFSFRYNYISVVVVVVDGRCRIVDSCSGREDAEEKEGKGE